MKRLVVLFVGDAGEFLFSVSLRHETGFTGADPQAKLDAFNAVFNGALFKHFDLVAPLAFFAAALPFLHALPGPFAVGDNFEEFRILKVPFLKRVSDVIPEFENVVRWSRPEGEGIEGIDRPARIETYQVRVKNLAFELETTVASLQLAEEFVLFTGQATAQFRFNDLGQRLFAHFVGHLRQVAFSGHFFKHGGVERGAA